MPKTLWNINFSTLNVTNERANGYSTKYTNSANLTNHIYAADGYGDTPAFSINAVDIDWNGAEINENITIKTTGDLLSWINNSIAALQNAVIELQNENQELTNKIELLERVVASQQDSNNQLYSVIVNDSLTVEDIIASIDTTAEKPLLPQSLNMTNLESPTDAYLVYPLSWEVIENDQIISPIVKDWNGFEIGFSINTETPTMMVDGIEYRVSDIKLGKGLYTIEFT